MHIATISSQRQITLPKAMLDQLALKTKDKVKIEVDNDQLVIKKTVSLMDLSGCLAHLVSPDKKGVPIEVARASAMKVMAKRWAEENESIID
ncbi:MAG TPA: AbrB/MazE/SpoVT family DNA-binding domain-containing protein [Candidatus Woesebacteria bacterium]|nr:AbrB/MazE/SpoVT family DNA-binding domain-containing protein [Candidatus Woesebacteria bacterium]